MNLPIDAIEILEEALGEYRSLERRLSAELTGTGISVDGWRVLRILGRSNALPMKEILETTHLPPASATRAVDTLVSLDLAFRRSDPIDRRSVQVNITPAGIEALEELDNKLNVAFSSLF